MNEIEIGIGNLVVKHFSYYLTHCTKYLSIFVLLVSLFFYTCVLYSLYCEMFCFFCINCHFIKAFTNEYLAYCCFR